MTQGQVLPIVRLPGVRGEILGNYLAALGLLRVLARQWPQVRISWKDGVLHVVGGPENLDSLVEHLTKFAQDRGWTRYHRSWLEEQKESTKFGTGRPLAIWQATADELVLELFCAHAVPRDRVVFNPLLGSGGNAGQREFANGWSTVVQLLAQPPRNVNPALALKQWLLTQGSSWVVSGVAAGSWFSSSNKLYNSGQKPYREEPISPWAMALACEGLAFFAGAASRRLGVRARARGAFPFVCDAAAPVTAGEAGRDRGEVWLPLWDRPMTLPEIRWLFQRGRAELHGRGVTSPAAFAAAIVQRGVDAGIAAFLRFALGSTTSANTFEPRYLGKIPVGWDEPLGHSVSCTGIFDRIVALNDRLPRDRKVGNRWQVAGLRGPIEAALIRAAENRADAAYLRALLDEVVAALDRVDRNVSYRKANVAWSPLPLSELQSLFADGPPSLEARLAAGFVSSFPSWQPFTTYRFGVERRPGGYFHPERTPARWVFGPGTLPEVLSAVVMRATLDREREEKMWVNQPPWPMITLTSRDVAQWLDAEVDEESFSRWLGRFALFDWAKIPQEVRALFEVRADDAGVTGPTLLVALFQPIVDRRPLKLAFHGARSENVLADSARVRPPGVARAIVGLARSGAVDAATRIVAARYAMANLPLMRTHVPWTVAEPARFVAALFLPLRDSERSSLIQRWLRPQRRKGDSKDVEVG